MNQDTIVALNSWYFIALLTGMTILIWLETAFYQHAFISERARTWHVLRNFGIWAIGLAFSNQLIGVHIHGLPSLTTTTAHSWIDWQAMPLAAQLALGVVILDFADYILHVLFHHFRGLWLVHAVHHSDCEMDVTTTLRFHPVESAANLIWGLSLLWILSLPLWMLAIRTLIHIPFTLMQHMNVAFPEPIDRVMRWIFVTPAMHRIHHSPLEPETNSNFGATFSVWDRIFGTYRTHGEAKEMNYGLAKLKTTEWQTVWGMLKTPLAARHLGHL